MAAGDRYAFAVAKSAIGAYLARSQSRDVRHSEPAVVMPASDVIDALVLGNGAPDSECPTVIFPDGVLGYAIRDETSGQYVLRRA